MNLATLKAYLGLYLSPSSLKPSKQPLKSKDKEFVDKKGNTLAHLAAIHKDEKTLLKLKPQMDIHQKNKEGFSVYHLIKYLWPRDIASKHFPELFPSHKLFFQQEKGKELQVQEADIYKQLHFHYTPHLCFASYPLLVINSYFWNEKNPDTKAFKQDFFLKVYEQELKEPPFNSYLKYINPTWGTGLFARKTLPKGALIGEYTGYVRPSPIFFSKNAYLFSYSLPSFPKTCIDAEKWGNPLRFINHSYEPNLQALKVFYENIPHLYFLTTKEVVKDEQLLIDYGPNYWSNKTPE